MKGRLRRSGGTALRWISVLAGVGAMVYVARRMGAAPEDMLAVPWQAHVAALLLMTVEVSARALRIHTIAGGLRVPLRFSTAVFSQLAADGAGAVTPSKVGSDPAKLWIMGRDGSTVGARGGILLGELAWEAVFLLLIAGALAVFTPIARAVPLAIFAYAVVVLGLSALAIWAARAAGEDPPGWWTAFRLTPERWRAVTAQGVEFLENARRLRSLPLSAILVASASTLLHIAARILVLVAILALWLGVPESGLMELILWPFGLLYLGTLLPPPGGGGVLELGFAAALDGTLGAEILPAALFWWRIYTFYLTAALGGLVLMLTRRGRARPRKGREDAGRQSSPGDDGEAPETDHGAEAEAARPV